jgi:hypothetical protein
MLPAIESVVSALAKEVVQLLQSGENCQSLPHGGRSGDVVMEVKRTHKLVPRRRIQPQGPQSRWAD